MVRREARNEEIQGKSLLAARRGIVLNYTQKLKKKKNKPQPSPEKFSVLLDVLQVLLIS